MKYGANSFPFPAFNPTALTKVKIIHSFGLSECNRIKKQKTNCCIYLGWVVQSIVSLTSSLRGQLLKCFRTS